MRGRQAEIAPARIWPELQTWCERFRRQPPAFVSSSEAADQLAELLTDVDRFLSGGSSDEVTAETLQEQLDDLRAAVLR